MNKVQDDENDCMKVFQALGTLVGERGMFGQGSKDCFFFQINEVPPFMLANCP